LCAAIATGESRLIGILRSEDTQVMIDALRKVGAVITEGFAPDGRECLTITKGVNRQSSQETTSGEPLSLWVANSGTTIRFLVAALSALGGDYRLDGVPRMRERPIADLLEAICGMGVQAASEAKNGCPPVILRGTGWQGGELSVSGTVSSQFLSGLLMAAPLANDAMQISVRGELVSRPYVEMTCRVMQSFGVKVEPLNEELFRIAPQTYRGTEYVIEPDASAASYPLAAAAMTKGRVTVEGLGKDSMQGDIRFAEVLRRMGCEVHWNEHSITVCGGSLKGVDVDMSHISDTVQTLAVVALAADGPTRVRGVAHNRFKESDRIGDLAKELRKLGAEVQEFPDGLEILPPTVVQPATIETYHDHRMAMSFALAGLVFPGVRVLDPSCTAKTYPNFFADLERLIGRPHHWERAEPCHQRCSGN
jgi:3-phosphoshikimate 1-carboxyvinyltransferase